MNKKGYLPKQDRKKLLLLSDDIRLPSGVGNMGREIITHTAHRFNWVNLGAAKHHKEVGKYFDLSQEINSRTGLEDSFVRLMPSNGYGNPDVLRNLIKLEDPDGIMIFTDPRQWIWLFDMEREIRNKIPLMYLNIWDNYPAPMYNRPYYESCDGLFAISKQTENINRIVLGDRAEDKVIKYIPHGINHNTFYPIQESDEDFLEFKKQILSNKEYEFIVLFNSRNIRRKQPGDIILAYDKFCQMIGEEKAQKCLLLMHTSAVDSNGTDLNKVIDHLTDPKLCNIKITGQRLSEKQMNYLYNLSDVNILLSSNEGWGLSLTESMMAGTMNICTVTGGMQDQCRFEDQDGNWVELTPEFPSNHRKTYTNHGRWCRPIFPASTNLQGSIPTPYIFEDKVNYSDASDAIMEIHNMGAKNRKKNGLKGREWATGTEAGFTAEIMGERISEGIDEVFDTFTPRTSYDLFKIKDLEKTNVRHSLHSY